MWIRNRQLSVKFGDEHFDCSSIEDLFIYLIIFISNKKEYSP
jgi:hypothetical protein